MKPEAVVNKYTDELLDITDNLDGFTRSDLQGIIEVIVRKIFEAGKEKETK